MKVMTISSPLVGGSEVRCTTGTCAGHGVPRSNSMRGAFQIGCPFAPFGLKNRPLSK